MVRALNLGIYHSGSSYLPEAHAYSSYLSRRGWTVEIVEQKSALHNMGAFDVEIHMCGLLRYDKRHRSCRPVVIHEYHSLSTGKYPKLKNILKSYFNYTPDGRIFLNNTVKRGYRFLRSVDSINRDMGVDKEFYDVAVGDQYRGSQAEEFDLVYCGSLHRVGMHQIIDSLASMGIKILLIGHPDNNIEGLVRRYHCVECVGAVTRNQLPSLYSKARMGLNYTPDIYPQNIQTSTKTLEYLAAGLGVVSNRYKWSEGFFNDFDASVLWLDKVKSVDDVQNFSAPYVDMRHYEWDRILDKCEFDTFLRNLVRKHKRAGKGR